MDFGLKMSPFLKIVVQVENRAFMFVFETLFTGFLKTFETHFPGWEKPLW